MSHKLGDSVKVTDGVTFDCPFCKGKATASVKQGMVIHTLPACTTYLRLDIVAFMKAVNDKLATN
jgi:hypothetical protein